MYLSHQSPVHGKIGITLLCFVNNFDRGGQFVCDESNIVALGINVTLLNYTLSISDNSKDNLKCSQNRPSSFWVYRWATNIHLTLIYYVLRHHFFIRGHKPKDLMYGCASSVWVTNVKLSTIEKQKKYQFFYIYYKYYYYYNQ